MKREPGMAYNTKTLNKVFAVLSVIFLVTTVWVFMDDFIRPWKKVQIEGLKIQKKVLEKKIAEAKKKLDLEKLKEIDVKIKQGEQLIQQRQTQLNSLMDELTDADKNFYRVTLNNTVYNANFSEYKYRWEIAHAKKSKEEKLLLKKLNKWKKLYLDNNNEIKKYSALKKSLAKKIETLKQEKLEAEKTKDSLVGALNRLKTAKSKVTLDFKKDPTTFVTHFIRNAPFLDFLDPTIRIRQIVMKDYVDDRYFRVTDKVDRCTTCHLNIDKPGFDGKDIPQPYRTHSNLDLIVGAKSPHPMKKIGCTNCHGGEGQRVFDFSSPAHTPVNMAQQKHWEEKYHWHAPHKIPREMYKLHYTESQCVKCHKGMERVPQVLGMSPGMQVNEGKRLIESYGCYACHKIPGLIKKEKPAPSLVRIKGKITKEFFKNWVWSPTLFLKQARMPSFFQQVNNSDKVSTRKNIAEVNAMAEFIFNKSDDYKSKWRYSGGNAERGKNLVQTIGCLGCHQADGLDDQYNKSNALRAPHLANLGSKLDPNWLVTWLIKPSHYQQDTIMPSFRLTLKEANDITAFLMASRNKNFEQLKFESMDKKVRDEILVTYFSAFDTLKVAKAKLESMTDSQRTMELGRRSVNKYGCYSCHEIDGFKGVPPIGPELSNFGNKPLAQMGFGHEHLEHKREVWLEAHLENPRRWDVGVDKEFKDLLRMPKFNFTKKEITAMSTFILGQVIEKIPESGLRNLTGAEKVASKGAKVISKYNCMGCHKIDSIGGEILKNYEDINEGPPWLVHHGSRVKADWLNNFFQKVYPIRPYLEVRMPSFNFTEEERNALVEYFRQLGGKDVFLADEKVVWNPGEKQAANKLWESFACASCHTGGFNRDESQAPDLHHAKRKLHPEWIVKWLSNPQAVLPHTVMPNFWEDGESQEPEILGGDPIKQQQALKKLILSFGKDGFAKPYPILE